MIADLSAFVFISAMEAAGKATSVRIFESVKVNSLLSAVGKKKTKVLAM